MITTVLAIFGLLLNIIDYEYDLQLKYVRPDAVLYPDPMKDPRNHHAMTDIIRLVIMITTILAIISLVMR